jgi:hypothetical protein
MSRGTASAWKQEPPIKYSRQDYGYQIVLHHQVLQRYVCIKLTAKTM